MKPIIMSKETESAFLKTLLQKFKKEWDSFKLNISESKFSVTLDTSLEAKDKITILYTPEAYLRMKTLVESYDTEVAWYGLVKKINDKLYKVYGVKVCKQTVNGSKVDTDDDDAIEFFNSLTDEEAEAMHFQAHSHVNFSTDASGVDLQNQDDVIRNIGMKGFYIFQIWNKRNAISTYLYDLDNNMFYNSNDVILDVEVEDGTLTSWVAETRKLVQEKKISYYPQYGKANNVYKKNDKGSSYLPGYWDGISYDERWD